MSSRVSLTSLGKGATLALDGHPSSIGVTIEITYGVDVLLHQPELHSIFSYWVDKNNLILLLDQLRLT